MRFPALRFSPVVCGLLAVAVLSLVLASLDGLELLVGPLILALLVAAIYVHLRWPKDRRHWLNRWQTPDTTTALGLLLRAGCRLILILALGAIPLRLIVLGGGAVPIVAISGLTVIGVLLPQVYWDVRRQYTRGSNDGPLQYTGTPKRTWRERLLVAGVGAAVLFVPRSTGPRPAPVPPPAESRVREPYEIGESDAWDLIFRT